MFNVVMLQCDVFTSAGIDKQRARFRTFSSASINSGGGTVFLGL